MNARLLVVDDEETVRQLVVKALEKAGYDCDQAGGYQPAVEKLRSGEYQVLLTDKNMPVEGKGNEGGMELIRWVRQNMPDLAVIVMTGFPTVDSAIEALKLGAFDYLLKPMDLALLRQKVDRVCEYRKFVNPEAVLDHYLSLNRDILETGKMSDQELETRLSHVQERLDDLFRTFRTIERALLDHRQRLAEIAAFAETSLDQLPADAPACAMLRHIAKEASQRI